MRSASQRPNKKVLSLVGMMVLHILAHFARLKVGTPSRLDHVLANQEKRLLAVKS